jgi:hypothetical protein
MDDPARITKITVLMDETAVEGYPMGSIAAVTHDGNELQAAVFGYGERTAEGKIPVYLVPLKRDGISRDRP